MTYSMTRFGIYESVKQAIDKPGTVMPFYQKVLLGGFAGCVGGFVGTPADMVNVRWYSAVFELSFRTHYPTGNSLKHMEIFASY